MDYFVAKIKYKEPVPNTDKEKSKSVQVLVNAMTVMEAETKVIGWIPSNYKDAFVDSVTRAKIKEIDKEGQSETWYEICVKFEQDNGKWTSHAIAGNGGIPESIIKRILAKNNRSAFESAKRIKFLIDDDLV